MTVDSKTAAGRPREFDAARDFRASSREPRPASHDAEISPRIGQTSYHQVRDAMRRDIVRGVFAGNARLKIGDLVARYGVSAAPIREAMGQLEADGLIVLEPNRGARVRRLDRRLVEDIFEIRIALEPVLVARCVALARPADVERCERLEHDFEAAVRAGDLRGIVELNGRFHATIYDIRPNREALRLMAQHSDLMSAFRFRFGFAQARFAQIIEEHWALLDACRRRDAQTGEAISRAHITHSLQDLLSRVED